MNLALRDVRRQLARFLGTAAGLGLLLSVVIAMQGIYAGMVDDATILTRAMRADLWLVQRATRGPFAEGSRLDPTVEARASAVPGVRRARPYTYQLIQREHRGAVLRIALVGLGWPDDVGRSLPLVRGRWLMQPHGEMIVDVSAGLGVGESMELAGEPYRVVGLTKNAYLRWRLRRVRERRGCQLSPSTSLPRPVLERQRVVEFAPHRPGRGSPRSRTSRPIRAGVPGVANPPVAAVLIEADPHASRCGTMRVGATSACTRKRKRRPCS
jgi:putative ABC transport system permease protein